MQAADHVGGGYCKSRMYSPIDPRAVSSEQPAREHKILYDLAHCASDKQVDYSSKHRSLVLRLIRHASCVLHFNRQPFLQIGEGAMWPDGWNSSESVTCAVRTTVEKSHKPSVDPDALDVAGGRTVQLRPLALAAFAAPSVARGARYTRLFSVDHPPSRCPAELSPGDSHTVHVARSTKRYTRSERTCPPPRTIDGAT
jgi:hypothetical protein